MLDWLDVARGLTELGFFGITAWLLLERREDNRERRTENATRNTREIEFLQTIQLNTAATHHLTDTLQWTTTNLKEREDAQTKAIEQLALEVRNGNLTRRPRR